MKPSLLPSLALPLVTIANASLAAPPRAQSTPRAAEVRSEHGFTRNVAVLVFDGVELLDFAGPVEAFSKANGWDTPFRIYTLAAQRRPLVTNNIVTVVPDYAIGDCPPPDILVIPGGETRSLEGNTPLGRFIRERVPQTEIVFSVCNGAFCLADAGFLDGLEATTFHSSIPWLREAAPKAKVRNDCRFVDNGHIVMAAGVSAGIDGALHLIDRLLGTATARKAADHMEYEWKGAPPAAETPADPVERARQAWYAGDWKAAEEQYRALAAQHPDDAIAMARYGTCLLFNRKNPEALEQLQRAANLGSKDARLYDALGLALKRGDRHSEAIDAWTTALELDPTSSGVRYQLGMELHEVGRYKESIPHLRHGWDLSIGGTDTIVALAHAQSETGDRDGALQSLQEAVDVDASKMAKHLADARFDALRKDPRFAALVARAKD